MKLVKMLVIHQTKTFEFLKCVWAMHKSFKRPHYVFLYMKSFVHLSVFSMAGLVGGRGVVIVMGRLTFVHAHSGRQPPPVLQAPKFCCK